MKQAIEDFLVTAGDSKTLDKTELKRLYVEIGNEKPKCDSDTCISKMLQAVRAYYHLNFEVKDKPETARKYVLKPGNHAFAPGGCADHNNDNTTDKQIAFYLKSYPHIEKLLVTPVK